MLKAEVVRSIDDTIVRDTVSISRDSFPPGWSCGNSEKLYGQVLRRHHTVLIVLRDNKSNVGFLFAVPHNDAVEDLKNDDPLMKEDANTYYVQNIAILPGYRRKLALGKILALLREELRKRDIFTVSMHARVSNGLSRTIQDRIKIVEIRRIDTWKYYGNEEPTDYIVAEWPHEKETM
jgi:ribosomal protein S18 acetylase RimI-like enzyme